MLHLILPAVGTDKAKSNKQEKWAWQQNPDWVQKFTLKIKWYVKHMAILLKMKCYKHRKDFQKEKTVFEKIWRKNWQDLQNQWGT